MDKFVKAEDVKDLLNGLDSLPWEDEVESMVDRLVIDDVEKVKHGKWTEKYIPLDWCDDDVDIVYECSICKSEEPFTSTYCPNCGAKMDLV